MEAACFYCIGHTPHCKQLLKLSVQWRRSCLLERCYRTIDRYVKEQNLPLASLKARWLALVPAQQASQNMRRFCAYRLTMALWPEALFLVHTALQFWPILSLVVRTFSPVPRVHSNQAHPRHVSMPSCNDTDYIRKMIIWKICFIVYSIIIVCRSREIIYPAWLYGHKCKIFYCTFSCWATGRHI